MLPLPPISPLTYTLFPYTPLFLSDGGTPPSSSSCQRFLDQTLIADLSYQPPVGSIVTRWAASHCALGVAAYNRQDPREWTRQGYRFWLGPVRPDQPGMREV